jgi:hypothetical protein
VFFGATGCCKQKFKNRRLELLRLCFPGMMSSLAPTRLTYAWQSNSPIRSRGPICASCLEPRN